MIKLNFKTWAAIGVAVIVVLLVVIYWPSRRTGAPTGQETISPSASAPSQTVSPQPSTQRSTATATITIISPAKSEQWALKTLHTIRWSREAGVKGQINLVSAATNQIVGWINAETTATQTSFEWNTSDVSIARYGGLKKDIGVGDYFVEIKFDNPRIPALRSGMFSILYPKDIKTASYTVSIKDFVASPSSVSLKRGDTLVIVNNDLAALNLSITGRGAVTVQPGQQEILNMATFSVGTYDFYSEKYPSLKLTVKVQ